MGYINEYSAALSMAIIDFRSYYYSLEELEKMLVQPMEDIAIIKKMKMNKNDACYVIMGYFNKINGYKKSISNIKKLIVKHQTKLKPYIHQNHDRKDEYKKALKLLENKIAECEPMVDDILLDCIEFLNECDYKIFDEHDTRFNP